MSESLGQGPTAGDTRFCKIGSKSPEGTIDAGDRPRPEGCVQGAEEKSEVVD